MRRRRWLFAGLVLVLVFLPVFAHPRARRLVRAWVRGQSGPCLLYVGRGCPPADRVEVFANGRLIGAFGERDDGEWWQRKIVFKPEGDTLLEFRIVRGSDLLYEPPRYREVLRPGDILRCRFEASDTWPTGFRGPPLQHQPNHYGPSPKGSSPAVVTGVPARVWGWFYRDRHHEDHVWVTVRGEKAIAPFRDRARRRGFRVVRESSSQGGELVHLTLMRPRDMTVVEAILEVETWDGVGSAIPEPTIAY